MLLETKPGHRALNNFCFPRNVSLSVSPSLSMSLPSSLCLSLAISLSFPLSLSLSEPEIESVAFKFYLSAGASALIFGSVNSTLVV